jgi:beta-glucosidase
MCAYGSINLVSDCATSRLYRLLYHGWGFNGFVRSDLGAVTNAPAAFAAGMDAIKPAAVRPLTQAIVNGTLPVARLDSAVSRILTQMFAYGIVARPYGGRVRTRVTNPAHDKTALEVAERSMVLLRNRGNVLPLSDRHVGSIAVIGADAASGAMSAGFGSAHVVAPHRSLPLAAIEAAVGRRAKVFYAPGGSSTVPAPAISRWRFAEPRSLVLARRIARHITPKLLTAMVGTGSFRADQSLLSRARAVITPTQSGPYVFSLTSNGNAWLSVGGRSLVSSPGVHARSSWSSMTSLQAGHRYPVDIAWYAGQGTGVPIVGMRPAISQMALAVEAARRAKVAVVFANDVSMEGTDRASLSLPSDENALISAVAAVNRHTVVVLNTGGAVYMPWISKVAAVVEGWYPGQEDGRATAAVLFGKVNPSGHLPITFPANASNLATAGRAAFPGDAGTVSYAEGLNIGYRYLQSKAIPPLFPFGFGLSYTTFAYSALTTTSTPTGLAVDVTVTNTGTREGTAVVQAYLQFPPSAGEPPLQLKAFAPVSLAPGASRVVSLSLPPSAFTAYLDRGWQTVPGSYELFVGSSSADLPLSASITPPVAVAPPMAVAPAKTAV